jgi:hypothetical protein
MFGKGGWLRRVASLADAAAAKQETPSPPIVRLARPEDYDRILDLGRDAFRHDPAFLYFVGAKDKKVRAIHDTVRSCYVRTVLTFT